MRRFSQIQPSRLLRGSANGAALVGLFALTFGQFPGSTAFGADVPKATSYNVISSDDPIARSNSEIIVLESGGSIDVKSRAVSVGRVYPPPQLERISVTSNGTALKLSKRPKFETRLGDRYAHLTNNGNYVFYTLDPDLQEFVSSLVNDAQASHVAIVAMNPRTGEILAIAGKSKSVSDVEYHAGFPAASLFKVVTAAAAVEQAGVRPNTMVNFRGGTYTLNEWNYMPDPRKDTRSMSVAEALGRSCNPVFGHLGSRYLNGSILTRYAHLFGFNRSLDLEAPLPSSRASIPTADPYELSRTAAGFGDVRISPVHAATLTAGIANGGLMPRPQLIDRIVSPDGGTIHDTTPEMIQRIVQPTTASTLMEMMEHTTTVGTSRKEFMRGTTPTLGSFRVAGKTGTLRGTDPVGLNNWFIGAGPTNNPQLAIAVITVDPRYSSKASHLGRLVFQKYFNLTPVEPPPAPRTYRSSKAKKAKVKYAASKKAPKKASYAKRSSSKKR